MTQQAKQMPGATTARPRGRMRHIVWLTALILGLWVGAATAQESTIGSVLVEGNVRIEVDTVRSYMAIGPGDEFDSDAVNESLKSLFATGLFADVAIRREGSALVVRVIENPIINRVAFEGNDAIDDSELEAEIQLQPRAVYTRPRVQTDLQRLTEIYRRSGRFAATIEPKVIQLPQNRVDLVFEVNEGPIAEVQRINFLGNAHFSDSALRDVIQTVRECVVSLRHECRHLRSRPVDVRPRAASPLLPRQRLRRFPRDFSGRRTDAGSPRLHHHLLARGGRTLPGRRHRYSKQAPGPRAGGPLPHRRNRRGRLVRRGPSGGHAARADGSRRQPRGTPLPTSAPKSNRIARRRQST